MSLKVRDRVTIIDVSGAPIAEGTIININDFREPEYQYAVDIDDYFDNPIFFSESQLVKIEEEK